MSDKEVACRKGFDSVGVCGDGTAGAQNSCRQYLQLYKLLCTSCWSYVNILYGVVYGLYFIHNLT